MTDPSEYDPVQKNFEYLDHTADIQIHAWGENLRSVYQSCAVGLFNYVCPVDNIYPGATREINISGKTDEDLDLDDPENLGKTDFDGLLFRWLDECLFLSACDPYFMAREIEIVHFDPELFQIRAILYGEEYYLYKHEQGTEVKAITYSAMQILEHTDEEMDETKRCEIFVVVDI
jgi:SHS2 domain-containing protein